MGVQRLCVYWIDFPVYADLIADFSRDYQTPTAHHQAPAKSHYQGENNGRDPIE